MGYHKDIQPGFTTGGAANHTSVYGSGWGGGMSGDPKPGKNTRELGRQQVHEGATFCVHCHWLIWCGRNLRATQRAPCSSWGLRESWAWPWTVLVHRFLFPAPAPCHSPSPPTPMGREQALEGRTCPLPLSQDKSSSPMYLLLAAQGWSRARATLELHPCLYQMGITAALAPFSLPIPVPSLPEEESYPLPPVPLPSLAPCAPGKEQLWGSLEPRSARDSHHGGSGNRVCIYCYTSLDPPPDATTCCCSLSVTPSLWHTLLCLVSHLTIHWLSSLYLNFILQYPQSARGREQ